MSCSVELSKKKVFYLGTWLFKPADQDLHCFQEGDISEIRMVKINYILASGDFCCLLITITNSLDSDQDFCSGSKAFDTLLPSIMQRVKIAQQAHDVKKTMYRCHDIASMLI